MQSRNRGWMILALFFCSGGTALVYEVIWSKLLSQMFGSSIYAQTVVLAAFMGGLALGNKLFGRWADGLRQPVRAYGFLELAIGIYAFSFPFLDRAADSIFVSVGTRISEHTGWLLLLKAALAAALLLGPTILMGGTLPLIAAWLEKSGDDAGRRSARFYSVNSLGAVFGAALAGFWVVQTLGIVAALRWTALVNVLIGGAAMLLGNRTFAEDKPSSKPASAADTGTSLPLSAGLIVALTGGVSMGLEVLSSRSLALIFGSSLQSFAVVLISFILGIGLGSAWIASSRRAKHSTPGTIILLLCIAAAWVALLVFNIERWVDFYRIARTGLGRTAVGYNFYQLLTAGIALVILGFPAACIGAVLPLMIRTLSEGSTLLGARVGALLTWNTLGAVGGVLLTGFVLMPVAGLRNAFAILALALAVAALLVALQHRRRAGVAMAVIVCAGVSCVFAFGGEGWKSVMSSGIFRVWEAQFDARIMPLRKDHIKILFYEDGPDATVSVEQVDGIIAPATLGMRTNGKPEAGTQIDVGTQLLVSYLPLFAKPEAKDVFVLGLGSGMTAGAVISYPGVKRLDIAENCEPVITGSHYFDDWNRHVLSDPRTHLWREDGRTVLKLHPQLYDVIITQPSNPWFVGTGSVFSYEYYKLAASRLKPGGIVAQWLQVYETQDDIVRLVLRTFGKVFPYVEIWDTGGGDLVLLGSLQPWPTGPEVFAKSFAHERIRTDMQMLDIRSPEALFARQLASQRTGFAIADEGPVQSDLHPIIEYEAPRAFYIGAGVRMLDQFDERTRQQLLAPPEKIQCLNALSTVTSQLIFGTFSTVNGELYGCLFGFTSSANIPCAFQTPNPSPPPGSAQTIMDQASVAFSMGNLDGAAQWVNHALSKEPNNVTALYLARVIDREKLVRQSTHTLANR